MSRSSIRSRLCRIEARLDQIIGAVPCRHCGARGPARLVAVYGTETPNVDPCPVCARPVLVLRTWIPRNPCDPPLPDDPDDNSEKTACASEFDSGETHAPDFAAGRPDQESRECDEIQG